MGVIDPIEQLRLLGRLLGHIAKEGQYIELATGVKRRHPKSMYIGPNEVQKAFAFAYSNDDVYINYCAQRQALDKRADASNAVDCAVLVFDLEKPEWHNESNLVPRSDVEALFEDFLKSYSWLKDYIFYAAWTGRGCQVVCLLESRKDATQYKNLAEALKAYFSKDYIDKASFGFNRLMRAPFSQRYDLNEKHTVEVIYYNPNSKLLPDAGLYAICRPTKRYNSKEYDDVIEQIKSRARFEDFVTYTSTHGSYSRLLCPFHNERNPSAFVYHNADGEVLVDGHTSEVYDVISFYQAYKNVDFRTAIKELCEKYGIEYKNGKNTNNGVKHVQIEVPEGAEEVLDFYVYHDDQFFYVTNKKTGATRAVSSYFRIVETDDYFHVTVYEPDYTVTKKYNKDNFNLSVVRKDCNMDSNHKYALPVYKYAFSKREKKKCYRYGYNKDTDFYLTQRNAHLIDGIIDDPNGNYRKIFKHDVDDQYLNFVREALAENKLFTIFASYALSSLLGNHGMLFIHGRSGIGKSSLAGFVSAFHGELFYSAANSTPKGIKAVLSELDRVCLVLDEAQKFPEFIQEVLVFSLDGSNSVHAAQNRTPVHARKTTNCIISTSETEFDPSAFKTIGASRRIWGLEITDWSDVSSKFSVLDFIHNKKYGLASLIHEFIKANNLAEKYDRSRNQSDYTYIEKTIAMCYILQDYFSIDLTPTIEKLKQLASVKVAEEVIDKNVIEEFYEFINKNENNFYSNTRNYVNNFFGWYEYDKDESTPVCDNNDVKLVRLKCIGLCVNPTFLKEFTKSSGKINKKTLIKKLVEKGILKSGESEVKRCGFVERTVRVYCIDTLALEEYIHKLNKDGTQMRPEPPAPPEPEPPTPPPPDPEPPTPPPFGPEATPPPPFDLEPSTPPPPDPEPETPTPPKQAASAQDESLVWFLEFLRRANDPKDTEEKTASLYKYYTVVCKDYLHMPPLAESVFWEQFKAACPGLDLTKEYFKLGELQAMLECSQPGTPKLTATPTAEPPSPPPAQTVQNNNMPVLSESLQVFVDAIIKWTDQNKETKIERCTLYDNYRKFCERRGLMPIGRLDFLKQLRAAYPNLYQKDVYTLGELQSILAYGQY